MVGYQASISQVFLGSARIAEEQAVYYRLQAKLAEKAVGGGGPKQAPALKRAWGTLQGFLAFGGAGAQGSGGTGKKRPRRYG